MQNFNNLMMEVIMTAKRKKSNLPLMFVALVFFVWFSLALNTGSMNAPSKDSNSTQIEKNTTKTVPPKKAPVEYMSEKEWNEMKHKTYEWLGC